MLNSVCRHRNSPRAEPWCCGRFLRPRRRWPHGCVAGAVRRLLRGAVAAAVLLTPTSTSTRSAATNTRHGWAPMHFGQDCWPRLAGHAEVDADRGVCGDHLHRHRGDGGLDLGATSVRATGADVVRRPDAGGTRFSADHDPDTRTRARHVLVLVLLLSGFGWMVSSRMSAGMTMSLREREFIRAARYMGVSSRGSSPITCPECGVDPHHRHRAERRGGHSWPKPV